MVAWRQVAQYQLYGCAYELIQHYLTERLNVEVTFVDSADVSQFKAAIRPNTKVHLLILLIAVEAAHALNR